MTVQLCLRLTRFLLLWIAGCSVALADGVALLSSERAAGFLAVSDAIQADLLRGPNAAESTIAYVTDGNALEALLSKSPRVVVTLGSGALRSVLASDIRLPVVATLIPRVAFEKLLREPGRKSSGPVHGLFLDQPFQRQLELLHLIQPEARRIGVLWGPDSLGQRQLMQAALASRGMTENPGIVGPAVTLGEATRQALDDADVLLAVADPTVFNSATVSNILMASYRSKLGVLAFSPAYVKAGALAAIFTTPAQIGIHAAETVRVILRGGSVPGQQYPNDFTVSVNEHVARSLGLSLDEAALTERLKRMERKQ